MRNYTNLLLVYTTFPATKVQIPAFPSIISLISKLLDLVILNFFCYFFKKFFSDMQIHCQVELQKLDDYLTIEKRYCPEKILPKKL